MKQEISPDDRSVLEQAYQRLEYPSLAAKLTNVIGTPVEQVVRLLPEGWYAKVNETAEGVIRNVLETAIASLGENPKPLARNGLHKILATGSGAIGGFFGLPALAIELPVTTGIILRAIAAIAHSEGEDLRALETRLACMEVFALGGPSAEDDAAETGYYGLRLALGLQFSGFAGQISQTGLQALGLPSAVNLIRAVAARFGIVVTNKAAAQMVPFVGAAGGAAINAIFVHHFQDIARGHFAVRRLEREYGAELIEAEYRNIAQRRSESNVAR